MTTKKPLREGLKQMLQEDHLNESEIAQLQISQQATTAHAPENRFSLKRLARSANLVVASLLLITLLAVGSFYPWKASDDTLQRIAQEVLTNHLKLKKLDLETSSMTDLRNYFNQLNFSPFYSEFLDHSDLRLLGARYCTLQGVIALQFRFLTPEGEMVTYYQALFDKEHFGKLPDVKEGKQPHVVNANGFAMSVWKEDGVVAVLAQAGK
jgi:hypothetical protein